MSSLGTGPAFFLMFDSCIAGNEANWGELLDFPMLCIFLSYVILYAFAMDNNFVLARVECLHLTVTSGGFPPIIIVYNVPELLAQVRVWFS